MQSETFPRNSSQFRFASAGSNQKVNITLHKRNSSTPSAQWIRKLLVLLLLFLLHNEMKCNNALARWKYDGRKASRVNDGREAKTLKADYFPIRRRIHHHHHHLRSIRRFQPETNSNSNHSIHPHSPLRLIDGKPDAFENQHSMGENANNESCKTDFLQMLCWRSEIETKLSCIDAKPQAQKQSVTWSESRRNRCLMKIIKLG